jgi:hypothetical protein
MYVPANKQQMIAIMLAICEALPFKIPTGLPVIFIGLRADRPIEYFSVNFCQDNYAGLLYNMMLS